MTTRPSANLYETSDLKPAGHVDLHVADAGAVKFDRTSTQRITLACLRQFRGRLPADFKFDRLAMHERG